MNSFTVVRQRERERAPNPIPEFPQILLVLVLLPIVVLLRHQISPCFAEGAVSLELLYISSFR